MTPCLTIWGQWQYEPTLFDNMILPEGVDNELVIDTIMQYYGACESFIQDVDILKAMIGRWSRRRAYDFQGMYQTTKFDYNPIENYDRKELFSDIYDKQDETTRTGNETYEKTGSVTTKRTGTESVEESGSETNEHEVSAYNSGSYSPQAKDTRTPNTTNTRTPDLTDVQSPDTKDTRTPDLNDTTKQTGTIKHAGRAHGNIGVTTTQAMIREERDILNFSIYNYIALSFADEFIITVF